MVVDFDIYTNIINQKQNGTLTVKVKNQGDCTNVLKYITNRWL